MYTPVVTHMAEEEKQPWLVLVTSRMRYKVTDNYCTKGDGGESLLEMRERLEITESGNGIWVSERNGFPNIVQITGESSPKEISLMLTYFDGRKSLKCCVPGRCGCSEGQKGIYTTDYGSWISDRNGIYFLQDNGGIYVGETKNLAQRFGQHKRNKEMKFGFFVTYGYDTNHHRCDDPLNTDVVRKSVEWLMKCFLREAGITVHESSRKDGWVWPNKEDINQIMSICNWIVEQINEKLNVGGIYKEWNDFDGRGGRIHLDYSKIGGK